MRAWNRTKLLWGYLTRRTRLDALPVEYIVETTAKCNLYCPMCPRETHKQPKADMADTVFERLVSEAGGTAEHMMLIGLGEPFMDPQIFHRIELCAQHTISTLISTNGTFLDEKTAEIDAAIAKKKRLIELLKEQKNILINRAVARGLNPDAPMRDSGVEWIGKIPAHWSLKRLCNLSRVVRGASPRPAGHPKYFTTEPIVPWVTAAEITKDESRYLTSTTEYLTVIGAKNSQAFSSGTVVFTNSGATLGVPKILAINCCANDGVLALKSLSPEIDKEFLYLFLSTTTVRLRDEMKQGGGQPNLNTGIVKNISIPIPDFDEQVAIVKFIDDYLAMNDSLLISASSQIDTLNSLKEVLISLAVFGKINVL